MTTLQIVNQLVSALVLLSQIVILFLLISFIFPKRNLIKKIFGFLGKKATALAFLVALMATLISLFYSEILGYTPCKLCWFQRVFIYPQVIFLGIALWRKDEEITDYIIILSVIGAFFAFYHHLLQIGIVSTSPCSVLQDSVSSCSQRFIMEYGYITFPLMSFTAFFLILLLMIIKKQNISPKMNKLRNKIKYSAK